MYKCISVHVCAVCVFVCVTKDESLSADSGPSVHELVDKENVDFMQYMGWEVRVEEHTCVM